MYRLFFFVLLISGVTAIHIRDLRELARGHPNTKIGQWHIGDVVLRNVEIMSEFLEHFTIQKGEVEFPGRTVSVGYTYNTPAPEFIYTTMIGMVVEKSKKKIPEPEPTYVSPHDYSDYYNLMQGSVRGATFDDLTNIYSEKGIINSGHLRAGAQLRYRGRDYIGPGDFMQGVFHQL